MKIEYTVHKLEFKKPVSVSRGIHIAHNTVLVRLHDGHYTGYGEATEFRVYGAFTDNIISYLKQAQKCVESLTLTSPTQLHGMLGNLLPIEPFALAALDIAAWDLWSKKENQQVRKMIGGAIRSVETSITLGLSSPDEVAAFLEEKKNWPRIKLKLGNEWDSENIQLLTQAGTGKHQVDVNAGWDLERAQKVLRNVPAHSLRFIEQPLQIDCFQNMQELRRTVADHDFFADEDFCGEGELHSCAQAYQGVNFKLMKNGGITPALATLAKARRLGLKASIGCMPESSIGVSAIAHVAHLFDYSDFDSIELIRNDPVSGIGIKDGTAVFNNAPGLGISEVEHLVWRTAI